MDCDTMESTAYLRDPALTRKICERIEKLAGSLEKKRGRPVKLMHVCGTHEHTMAQFGIRSLLPTSVEVIPGPGCPVCVCPTEDIDTALALTALPGVTVCTFGDMIRVPSSSITMDQAKAEGADIRVVYGPSEAVDLARKTDGEVVFFAIGFETTVPVVAVELLDDCPDNFSIICAHKTIPPVMELLMNMSALRIDGFITPGHVAAIIGCDPFDLFSRTYKIPNVVAGFEPNDLLLGIYMLLKQLVEGESFTGNEYTRVVRTGGNPKAQEIMGQVFRQTSSKWRGIGRVPSGGFELRPEFERFDATKKFDVETPPPIDIPAGCSCHLVIVGRVTPDECPLFRTKCTPLNPVGPCMVSHEGTCNIAFKYGVDALKSGRK
ncbi:MAG: hydrogenase formation protein HypD [Promethearchaeota archaeon]